MSNSHIPTAGEASITVLRMHLQQKKMQATDMLEVITVILAENALTFVENKYGEGIIDDGDIKDLLDNPHEFEQTLKTL